MGANMARRLQERGYHVTTLFDANRSAVIPRSPTEISADSIPTLGDVTARADEIFNRRLGWIAAIARNLQRR
jgi:3-hydroxyisobutyrate dehydrogenase-like beta-hydroxyacid dehydrogenase